jgi:hypothetical protein
MPLATITAFGLVIHRLIQLVDRREKLNRNTFTDFVAPAMSDFDAAHKDYMECSNSTWPSRPTFNIHFQKRIPSSRPYLRIRYFQKT